MGAQERNHNYKSENKTTSNHGQTANFPRHRFDRPFHLFCRQCPACIASGGRDCSGCRPTNVVPWYVLWRVRIRLLEKPLQPGHPLRHLRQLGEPKHTVQPPSGHWTSRTPSQWIHISQNFLWLLPPSFPSFLNRERRAHLFKRSRLRKMGML